MMKIYTSGIVWLSSFHTRTRTHMPALFILNIHAHLFRFAVESLLLSWEIHQTQTHRKICIRSLSAISFHLSLALSQSQIQTHSLCPGNKPFDRVSLCVCACNLECVLLFWLSPVMRLKCLNFVDHSQAHIYRVARDQLLSDEDSNGLRFLVIQVENKSSGNASQRI